jgi:hypothetical protein
MADATIAAEAPPQGAAPPEEARAGPNPTIEMSAEEVAAAAEAAGAAQAAKQAKAGKEKGKKGKKAPTPSGDGPSIAAHPRAVRSIARAKSWGGLLGFLLGGYLSLPTYTLAGVGLRALLAGVACYLAVWAGGVFLWRRLVVLEIKAREQQLMNEVLAAAGITDGAARPGAKGSGGKAS